MFNVYYGGILIKTGYSLVTRAFVESKTYVSPIPYSGIG